MRKWMLGAVSAVGLAMATIGAAQAADPVKIGFSISKTGTYAVVAPSQLNAYELWRDEVNASGGLDVAGTKRPVEFMVYDDQSDPAQTVKIYERLITTDKADLLLPPWGTTLQMALAAVAERYKFPVVGNTAASVQLRNLKPGNVWFPTAAFPDRVGAELAKMLKGANVATAAVLTNQLPFGLEIKQALLPALKAEGIKVVVDDGYPPDTRDMTAMLSKVRQAKPDAVIALAYPGDSILYMTQARELGIAAPYQFIMVGPGIDFFRAKFKAETEGIITIGHWSPRNKQPGSQAFYDAYVKKFNTLPDYLDSAESFVSLQILQQAVAKAGLDKGRLREAIAAGTFETIYGPVHFTGVENKLTPTGFLQMQKGELEIVWPKDKASATLEKKTGWQ